MATLSIFDVSPYVYTAANIDTYNSRICCNFPVGGVHFFLKNLTLAMKVNHDIIVCFDSKSFRKNIDESYKGNRHGNYPVYAQLNFLYNELERCGIPCYKLDGYEADDLVHTAVMQNKDKYDTIYIYSADRDLAHNILNDKIFLEPVNSRTQAISKGNFLSAISKDCDVLFNTVSMFKCLTGDKSDNLPAFKLDNGTKGMDMYRTIYTYLIENRKYLIPELTTKPEFFEVLVGSLFEMTEADKERLKKHITMVYPRLAPIDIVAMKPWDFGYDDYVRLLHMSRAQEALRFFGSYPNPTESDKEHMYKVSKEYRSGEFAADKSLPLTPMDNFGENLFIREFD